MSLRPATREAMDLLIQGAQTMARIEQAGLRIDTARLDNSIKVTKARIGELDASLRRSKEYKTWARLYGNRMSIESRQQLARVMFRELGHRRNPLVRDLRNDNRDINSAKAFDHLDSQFVKDYFQLARLRKAYSTNLLGIRREVVDGYLHPFFDLHTVESYRSSSSRPNLHNFPVRIKEISEIVRSCVIPRKGHVLLEADYGAQEVRVNACYNKDPRLIDYVVGGGDMHKDMAKRLFMLTDEELGDINDKESGKPTRYVSKSMYVFPEFYGSVYAQCAPNLWEAIGWLNLRRSDGVSLYDHLKSKGIRRLGACDYGEEPQKGTFERQVKKVEEWMWGGVFTVYDQWKRDWWAAYQREGGFNTLTGFCLRGLFRRNQVLCDPAQGSAFHCLLWSLIRMDMEMRRKKMKSKIICQIHDSALFDAHRSEVQDLAVMFHRIAVEEVAEAWKWIIVPLEVGYELAEENWFLKKPMVV